MVAIPLVENHAGHSAQIWKVAAFGTAISNNLVKKSFHLYRAADFVYFLS